MPYQEANFVPGIDLEKTPVKNAGGWSASQLIRFREGLPEKNGGWTALNMTAIIGTAREIHAWADQSSLTYIGIGTEQALELFLGGNLYNITPVSVTDNLNPAFATTIHSTTVVITDGGHSPSVGDWVNVVVPVSIGGIVVQGFYQITTVAGSAHSITAAAAASATASGGAVPLYSTTNTLTTVTVTLNDHGYAVDQIYVNQVATTVGGVTLGAYAPYAVQTVVDANNFTITTTAATSTTTGSENAGHARLSYLLPTGAVSAAITAGFGEGEFGQGLFSSPAASGTITPPTQWFLDNWGEDLIGNRNGTPIFVWVPPYADGNFAITIDTTNYPGAADPPTAVNVTFVAMPQRILMALGCDPPGGGNLEPLLVRWCDVEDFTDWTATAVNQAGSYLLPTGSAIIGGIQAPLFGVIWTDIDMWLFTYLGFPLVWGFIKVEGGAGLLSPTAACVAGQEVFFASSNSFRVFDGSAVRILPCPVWDFFWRNLNRTQVYKVNAQSNSWFNEVAWAFPSASGAGEIDSYVRFNYVEGVWDCGALVRTCWIDENVFGAPIGVDANGFLQQHETATDANGQPLGEYIQSGYLSISDGTFFAFLERFIADLLYSGNAPSVQIWIATLDYPTDTPVIFGPFTQAPTGPEYQIVRARGRYASLKIGFSTVGTFWRFGGFKYLVKPAGKWQ